jgi:hypothetical protein
LGIGLIESRLGESSSEPNVSGFGLIVGGFIFHWVTVDYGKSILGKDHEVTDSSEVLIGYPSRGFGLCIGELDKYLDAVSNRN